MPGLPDWAKPGVAVVCIDDDWEDFYSAQKTTGPCPVLNGRYTIGRSVADYGFVMLSDPKFGDSWWEVSAFRPLTPEERDVELFAGALKGAAVSPARELERA